MPFAPHEIENKRFVVGLRGYSTAEVDAFLRAVAADYAAALEAARSAPVAESEEIVRAAERKAAELLEAARSEAQACYDEIDRRLARHAEREAEVRLRLEQLERAVADAVEALSPRAAA